MKDKVNLCQTGGHVAETWQNREVSTGKKEEETVETTEHLCVGFVGVNLVVYQATRRPLS